MSLYPEGGGSSTSIYPDSQPTAASFWSLNPAISDVTIPGPYNLYVGGHVLVQEQIATNNNIVAGGTIGTSQNLVVGTTAQIGGNTQINAFLNVEKDIEAGGNITADADFLGLANCRIQGLITSGENITAVGYIQAGGKVQTPQVVLTNTTTPAITSTLETGANGFCVIEGDSANTGIQVLDGNGAPGVVSAGTLQFPGGGGGTITNLEAINGVTVNSLVTNPLQVNLNCDSYNLNGVGTAYINTGYTNLLTVNQGLTLETNPGYGPTVNTGQIYFDGANFQFSAPIRAPLVGSGYGPFSFVGNAASDYNQSARYASGSFQWNGQFSWANPYGFGGTNYNFMSIGLTGNNPPNVASGTTYPVTVYNPVGDIQFQNFPMLQVRIVGTNSVGTATISSSALFQCYANNVSYPISVYLSVPSLAGNSQPQFSLEFMMVKGIHYNDSSTMINLYFLPSGTQQLGNVYGSSPPGSWFNWSVVGML